MGGMERSSQLENPVVTQHFNTSLWHQMIVITLLGFVVAVIVAIALRRRAATTTSGAEPYEPPVRRVLRVGFGCLWIIAGLLQLQREMPIGLPTQVVQPSVADAPAWVQHLVNIGVDAWLRHPILAATGTVWLQLGLGLWLVAAKDGWWSRAAGWFSAGWALCIWMLGNGFGGFFVAPISWMFGAPGATAFYAVAGVAVGAPRSWLTSKTVATWSARAVGIGLVALGVLQAWPGRGFWSSSGQIPAMAHSMAATSQPGIFASLVRGFATVSSHGAWVVNGIVVVALLFVGVVFLTGTRRLLASATIAYVVLAMLDWVFVQDLGVFGGVGTDVNSMIPSALVVVATSVFLSTTDRPEPDEHDLVLQSPTFEARTVASGVFATMFTVGVVLMASVAVLPGASADAAIASGSQVVALAGPAPNFTLTDQTGRTVSLTSLRGKTVVLAFLDPLCTNDCPVEAQELHLASESLGANARVVFVAVNANPDYRSVSTVSSFTRAEGLSGWTAWHFLTGSLAELNKTWDSYGVEIALTPAGGMVDHTEPIYVISPSGHLVSTWTATVGNGASTLLGSSTRSLIVAQAKAAS